MMGCALATAVVIAGSSADARPGPMRVVVLVASEGDRQLAARVRGQTADLDLTLRTAEVALPTRLDAQRALARQYAGEGEGEGAAVVWFGVDGEARVVHVLRGDRLLERTVGGASGSLSESATIETVGMVVRTALLGLASLAAEPPAPASAPAPGLEPWAELSWTVAAEGTGGTLLHQGAAARLGGTLGRWRAGAWVSYQPPLTLSSGGATVRLERWQVGVAAGFELWPDVPSSGWRLGVELGVLAAAFPRTTTATSAGLTPTAAHTTWTPVAAPGVRAARRLVGPLWLALTVGADLLLGPPQLGETGPAGFRLVAAAWPVQPRAALGLALDAP
jgi:hypothetical protein